MVKYQQNIKNISPRNIKPRAFSSIAPAIFAQNLSASYIYCSQVYRSILWARFCWVTPTPCSSAWKHPLDCNSLSKLDQIEMPRILILDTYFQCLSPLFSPLFPLPLPSPFSPTSVSPSPNYLEFTFSMLLLGRSESCRNLGKLLAQEENILRKVELSIS